MNQKVAYIAGGCFWGMEDLFRKRKGILDTEVGYLGGENENPTYKNIGGMEEVNNDASGRLVQREA